MTIDNRFRRGSSTTDAVGKFIDHAEQNFNKSKVTGELFLDLREAFDTVNHTCLLQKHPYYGILDNKAEWFTSYLFNRSQIVSLEGHYSEKEFVTHCVPQGSFLGPLLFIIMINDLPSELRSCQFLMYADDTVIYFSDVS